MLPYYLAQLPFITQANIHDHSTRTQNQLRTNKPQREHARYCVRHKISKVINSAPIHILTKINTHTVFKILANLLVYNLTKKYVAYIIVTFVLDHKHISHS